MLTLDGPLRQPAHGKPTSVVVLLHGYGADGHDLIDLADAWREALPSTLFLAPDAPGRIADMLNGRQWFPLVRRDAKEIAEGVRFAQPILDRYLDSVLTETNLTPDRMALFGFSQGAMMALHVGLRRSIAPAALLAYSGRLAAPENLTAEITCWPPVLLLHGEDDDVIPCAAMAEARESLIAAGVPVEAVAVPHLGHGIDANSIDTGLRALFQSFETK